MDKTIRFTESKIRDLVIAYYEHELLWKTNHIKFHNKTARDQAFEDMAKKLNIPGLTGSIVSTKIRNVRASYCGELRKIQKSLEDGSGEPYLSGILWFDMLDSFLRPYMHLRPKKKSEKPTLNNNSPNKPEKDVQPTAIVGPSEHNSNFIEEPAIKKEKLMDISESYYQGELNSESTAPAVPERLVDTHSSSSKSIVERIRFIEPPYDEDEQSKSVSQAENNCKDEYEYFGKYVAYALRNMTRANALKAKMQIQEIVSRVQLQRATGK